MIDKDGSHDPPLKKKVGRKGSIWLLLLFIIKESWGKNSKTVQEPEAGTDRGALLTGSLLIACLACFLVQPRATYPRSSNTYSGLGLPTSITGQENAPQTCLQINLMQTFSQLRLLPFWWLICIKLTIKNLISAQLLIVIAIKYNFMFKANLELTFLQKKKKRLSRSVAWLTG